MAEFGHILPPGARGYLIGERSMQTQGLNQLGMLSGLVGVRGALSQQQQLEDDLREREQIKGVLSQTGGDPKKAIPALLAFGSPKALGLAAQLRTFVERPGLQPVGAGGLYDPSTQTVIPPAARPAPPAPFADVHNVPGGYIQKQPDGTMKFVRTQQEPKEPSVAPTRGQVVDPKDVTRLLEVDLKTYKGGSLGDVGVFGIAGREPGAAKREEKSAEGRDLLKTELDNLREHYRVLNEAKAIPSSDRSAVSNAMSYLQGSAVGQIGGAVLGTKEQDARNQIRSSRLRIMNAIKNTTGMSAQMLNSNVELRTWLDSLTDPTNSYESNVGIIDAIEENFLKKSPGSMAPPPTPGLPSMDAIDAEIRRRRGRR